MSVRLPETASTAGAPQPVRRADPGQSHRLVLEAITKAWDRKRGPVLDAVDLVLEPGTIVSLVGPNGTGKTTLLRIAAGLITADSGTVRLDGLDPRTRRREFQRRLGFLSAGQTGLYARLSVRAHLDFWATISFVPRGSRRDAVEAAIDRFSLGDLASRRVDRLSMGQRQRVRLAMAFLHEPRLVLLDEPQNSLDEDGIALLNEVLGAFAAIGGTALCCSPRGDMIDSPSEVLELRHGKLT